MTRPAAAETSPLTADSLRRLTEAELSLNARVGHIALLLAALLMTIAIASLWMTEPALPLRTQIAFAAMTLIGASWSVYALRVLTGPRILFVRHRVVAGQMAVTFTGLFVAGTLALGITSGSAAAYLASALGVVMLGAAVYVLRRARQALAELIGRREAIEGAK